MERDVRYCTTSDGVSIAYCVEGEGPPLVMTPFLLESFLLEDMSPLYRGFSRRLAGSVRLVQYDPRGVGSSQRDAVAGELDDFVRDLEAVVKATGLGRVALFGRAVMAPIAMRFAARHVGVVDRLVLQAPSARLTDRVNTDETRGIIQICRGNWDMATRMLADMSSREEFGDKALQNAAWYRKSASGEVMARLLEVYSSERIGDAELKQIESPTLVLQPMNDARWIAEAGQRIAAAVPGASLALMPGGLHTFAFGDPEPLLQAIFKFIGAESRTSVESANAVRTVLFTDLVGHTEMMSRLGDELGRDVLREHERITREVLKANGGTEVKTMGDGFMASFGSVTKAVECAVALQKAFADHEGEALSVRVGLNAGEPIEEDGDLFGATVILASRIAAKAEGGEILVADTVRGLCSGKGFLFSDRGEFVAKGFEEPVRLCAVRWRG